MITKEQYKKAWANNYPLSHVEGGIPVRGYDFNKSFNLSEFLRSFETTGFQATHMAKAIGIIRRMKRNGCKVYLGYTSNMVSSGLRDIIRFLVQHKMVDVIVSTAGGIEEDFIKCFKPFIIGDFRVSGRSLHDMSVNRTGNLFVPNDRYIAFEKFLSPILEELRKRQTETGTMLTPSALIRTMAERIGNENSIYHWAAKNNIPVYCPAITDGAIGDVLFFYKYNHPELRIDITDDIFALNASSLDAKKTGIILLGAGTVKHTICNANIFRDGADYAVYINTSSEYDGSDSGAEPEEAISWGKLAKGGEHVKVVGDATIIFPLIVATLREEILGKKKW